MSMKSPSQLDRLRSYLADIHELEESTGVIKSPKKMIKGIQRRVNNPRLRQRIYDIMCAGTVEEKAAF